MPLVILVEFEIKRDAIAQFRSLILANARSSLHEEPGCRRFDVLHNSDEPHRVVLYEIYDDVVAFDHHVTTPHYKTFAAAAEGLIETRSVKRLAFVDVALNGEAERKTSGRVGA
jgi:autoinducer 2-degrading protein